MIMYVSKDLVTTQRIEQILVQLETQRGGRFGHLPVHESPIAILIYSCEKRNWEGIPSWTRSYSSSPNRAGGSSLMITMPSRRFCSWRLCHIAGAEEWWRASGLMYRHSMWRRTMWWKQRWWYVRSSRCGPLPCSEQGPQRKFSSRWSGDDQLVISWSNQ